MQTLDRFTCRCYNILYGVTADEIAHAFVQKHDFDMHRDYDTEYKEKYNG